MFSLWGWITDGLRPLRTPAGGRGSEPETSAVGSAPVVTMRQENPVALSGAVLRSGELCAYYRDAYGAVHILA